MLLWLGAGISEAMAIVGSFVGTLASGMIWGLTRSWATVCYCAAAGPVLIVLCTAGTWLVLRSRACDE